MQLAACQGRTHTCSSTHINAYSLFARSCRLQEDHRSPGLSCVYSLPLLGHVGAGGAAARQRPRCADSGLAWIRQSLMLSLVQQQLLPLQTSHFPEKHLPGFLMPIPHPLPEKRTLTPPFPHTRCYSTGYLCHTCSFSLLLPQLSQLCARAWFASPPRSPFRSQICLTCPEKVPFGGTLSQHRLECSCVSRNDSL